jgi:hypothetical protein
MREVYARLSDEIKQRLKGLTAIHDFQFRQKKLQRELKFGVLLRDEDKPDPVAH